MSGLFKKKLAKGQKEWFITPSIASISLIMPWFSLSRSELEPLRKIHLNLLFPLPKGEQDYKVDDEQYKQRKEKASKNK